MQNIVFKKTGNFVFLVGGLFFAGSAGIAFAFSGKWLLRTPVLLMPAVLVGILAFGAIWYFFLKTALRGIEKHGYAKTAILICAVAFLSRIAAGCILSALNYTMVSDYLYAHDAATGAVKAIPAVPITDYFRQRGEFIHFMYATYWGHHIGLLHFLSRFFGHCMFLNNLLNAIADTGVVWLVMSMTSTLFRSRKAAVTAAVIYALFPTSIICCNWFSGEFLGVALLVLGIWCLLEVLPPWCEGRSSGKIKKFIFAVIAGISLGASNMMKPIAIVVFVTFLVFEAGRFLCGSSAPGSRWKPLLKNLILIFVAAGASLSTALVLKKGYERYTGYREFPSPMAATLFVGLNPEYRGMYNKKLSELCISLAQEFNGDPAKIDAYYRAALKRNLKKSWKKLPVMFVHKTVLIFGSESWPVDRIASGLKTRCPGFRKSFVGLLSYQWCNLYYAVILCGVAAVFFFIGIRKRRLPGQVLLWLSIVMGTGMQMVVEAQPRYRVSLLNPLMAMAAGYGLIMTCRLASRRISGKKAKNAPAASARSDL